MERWILYAIISMIFAGCTSVVAKMGLSGISGEVGLAVRNVFVFLFVTALVLATGQVKELHLLTRQNFIWLGVSGLTTAVSWLFYYKAIKEGNVSTVAMIDKGSVVIAVALAMLILGERITIKSVAGCLLIVAGLVVITRK